MYQANNEKRNKTNKKRNRTTESRKNENNRRKENCKYFGLLEANTIKQAEMKGKIYEKRVTDERDSFLKPSSAAEMSKG